MGYGMAVNLRSKLDNRMTFYVCDVNEQAINRFKEEVGSCGPVEVVENGAEAAQVAVSCRHPARAPFLTGS
jgi:hypothetical protein